jgi:hypothetical protein
MGNSFDSWCNVGSSLSTLILHYLSFILKRLTVAETTTPEQGFPHVNKIEKLGHVRDFLLHRPTNRRK